MGNGRVGVGIEDLDVGSAKWVLSGRIVPHIVRDLDGTGDTEGKKVSSDADRTATKNAYTKSLSSANDV